MSPNKTSQGSTKKKIMAPSTSRSTRYNIDNYTTRLPLTALLLPVTHLPLQTYINAATATTNNQTNTQPNLGHRDSIFSTDQLTWKQRQKQRASQSYSVGSTSSASNDKEEILLSPRFYQHHHSLGAFAENDNSPSAKERTYSLVNGLGLTQQQQAQLNGMPSEQPLTSPRGSLEKKRKSGKVSRGSQGSDENSLTRDEHAYGSVEALRNRFLDFVKACGEKAKEKKERLDDDLEMKITFMDYMYDGITRKPSKLLKDIPTVMAFLETFCHNVIFMFDSDNMVPQYQAERYPYLRFMVETVVPNPGQFKWFTHARMAKFLKDRYDNSVSQDYPPLRTDEIHMQPSAEVSLVDNIQGIFSVDASTNSLNEELHTASSSTSGLVNKNHTIGLLEEIHMVCDMFFYELEDYFVLYQEQAQKFVHRWVEIGLRNNNLPSHVIEVYKRKLEYNESMQECSVNSEDLIPRNVIDKDWKFLRYLAKEYSPDWSTNYKDIGTVVQWKTDVDITSDKLKLRTSKIIGYFNESIENVVKTFSYDSHFKYAFEDIEFNGYNAINASHSLHKYPSATVSAVFNFGALFSKRKIDQVISCKSTFTGEELTEHMIFYKSCEPPSGVEPNKKELRFKFMGLRLLSKLDTQRTRYVEFRSGNLGGVLNSSFIQSNPIVVKKLVKKIHNGFKQALKESEENGFEMPSYDDNYMCKIWTDYCLQYCGIDVREKYK